MMKLDDFSGVNANMEEKSEIQEWGNVEIIECLPEGADCGWLHFICIQNNQWLVAVSFKLP